MNLFLRITVALLLLSFQFDASSQNLSNKGKEFWVGYGHHQFFESSGSFNSQTMVLYISAEEAATVTISIPGTGYGTTYSIPANTVFATPAIPKAGTHDARLWNPTNCEGLFQKGIRILSDVPIVAYAHIYGSASSGATMLMPTDTWGYNYISVNSEQSYASDCYSWMYVVAKENNTKITITPSVNTRGGRPAGVPFDVVLNRGEIYQILGALVTPGSSDGRQLTGTTVKSIANNAGNCFPVAVFSGSSRTSNPASCGQGGGDNDMQQLFPGQAWGRRYLTAPTSSSNSASVNQTNSYKIVVRDPSTVVRRNGVVMTGLIGGKYYRFESNQPELIEANQPIMVAQFMTGGNCSAGGLGDPEMIYISPLEQGIKRIGFYRNTLQNITVNYLTLIIPTTGLPSLTIDGVGTSTFTHTYPHPRLAGYTVVIKRWNATQAQCLVRSDSAFTAITYGLGSVESYGYNAGTLINNLNVIGAVQNTLDPTSASHLFTCRNTPAAISMLVAYKPTNMIWTLSSVATISPNADVAVANPSPVDSVLISGTWYYKYTLPGTYSFSDTGQVSIPVRTTHPSIENCNNSESVTFTISVKEKPRAVFSFNHTGCIADTVYFNSPANSGNGYTIGQWNWTFPGGISSNIANPAQLFTSTGAQPVSLQVITTEGCVSDTTASLNVFARPVADFTVSQNNFCKGGNTTFTPTQNYSGPNGTGNWYWDFGTGTPLNANNGNAQQVTYPDYGSYTVKYVYKASAACISDTVSKTVNVFAAPSISIAYPAGCLPTSGTVQFTNNTTVPDGQAVNHNWTFGDANANASNPNTSTLASPTHNYGVGSYQIQYSATTVNGCSKDTSFTASFNLKPLLSYNTTQAPLCVNGQPVSLANGTVTNGVPGTATYRGPGTSANGSFNPSVAGPGTHTIWYVFASNGGCTDSLSTTVQVNPKPSASFSATANVCQGTDATLTDESVITAGSISSWTWIYSGGTTATYNNGNPFNYNFPAAGAYTVRLITTSNEGCTSDTALRTVNVRPLPTVAFTMPASICMPNGNAQFTSGTNIVDNGALSYSWNFGDGGTSNQQNPQHTYTNYGPVPVTLTATSAYGCVSSLTQTFNAFYDKPVAQFAVAPDTLCQGSNNVFTDGSTAANSTVQSWNWTFGDGSSSGTANPVKRYNNPGNYPVTLTVTSAAGCISDPFRDTVIVYLQPVINAGPSFVVPQGTIVRFNPTANDSSVLNFQWTPAAGMSGANVLRPSIIANINQTYTLTATGPGGCTASDTMTVRILKPITVPNSFSPNNDGINDLWIITNLADYAGAIVEVFNRYGQPVYRSNGYSSPWNGTFKGGPVPFGTYYYVITLNNGFKPITGSVTIVR